MRRAGILLAVLALGACGEEERRAAAPTATPRPVATNDPRTQEIREAANAYLAAVAEPDWAAARARSGSARTRP